MRSITAIFLCLLSQSVFAAECKNRTTLVCPSVNSECFASDAGKSRASVEIGPKGYLECNSDCIWSTKTCQEGKYYTERLQDCVLPEDADSGAALFGCGRRMKILNPEGSRYITECSERIICPNSGNFSADWLVVGNREDRLLPIIRRPISTFDVERLDNSDYYTFEFRSLNINRKSHVLTESGTNLWSKLYKEDPSPDNMVWRVVPTAKSFEFREMYRLVSPVTGRALTTFGLNLEMKTLLERDEQFWVFKKA